MRCIKSLLIILSLFSLTAYAEEEVKEKFPKTGYVKNDGAVIKAGDNVNFEDVCVLSKSEPVKIMDRRYSWLKVLLPRKAYLYINKDYVDLTSDEKGIGIVNAANVNLRAGSGTRYSIIGQISKPEKVSILSEDAGWYKIEPPYGTTGWVHSGQIEVAEESAIKHPEKKETVKEVKQENVKPSAVVQKKEAIVPSVTRLKANYPMPKGNLSISASTKKDR